MMRTLAIVVAWLAVSALVVVLAVQNRGLRTQRDALADRAQFAYLGMYVPETALTTLDGESILLGTPADGHQVVFFFNHTCPYCERSGASVAAAARALRAAAPARASMLGVCLCTPDEARGFAQKHRFDFPVATLENRRLLALYRARNVPALMAINADGRVFHAVQGTFNTQTQVAALVSAVEAMPTGSLPGERMPMESIPTQSMPTQSDSTSDSMGIAPGGATTRTIPADNIGRIATRSR